MMKKATTYRKAKVMAFLPFCLITFLLFMASCDSYLDELPDNRMSLKSTDEVSKLLVTAYPQIHPAYLLEMYSDNADEYDVASWTEANKFQSQAWHWDDITEIGDNESPQVLWQAHYGAVNTANTALEYINGLSADEQKEYAAQKGEALVCRAFAMFQLANIFCMAYDPATASQELGLPYPTATETDVENHYERGTLAELYQHIDADLQAGLPLLKATYDKPKFHFTPSAACAFATRFYLYAHQYDKAIDYASRVLGDNAGATLRDWASYDALSANGQIQPNAFVSSSERANLLLLVTYSQWGSVCGPSYYGAKYAHGALISANETMQSQGPWGISSRFHYTVWYNSAISKFIFRKVPFAFEYTDLQAGSGYAHGEFPVFTTDELLLERAEAYALTQQYDKALGDINTFLAAFHKDGVQLTLSGIRSFYSSLKTYTPSDPTPRKPLHVSFAIDSQTEEPLLQCILQLRRILTLHEGLRLQDVKRYGITIYRRTLNAANTVEAVTDSLMPDDPRRAIQLPKDVLSSLQPNPRN